MDTHVLNKKIVKQAPAGIFRSYSTSGKYPLSYRTHGAFMKIYQLPVHIQAESLTFHKISAIPSIVSESNILKTKSDRPQEITWRNPTHTQISTHTQIRDHTGIQKTLRRNNGKTTY